MKRILQLKYVVVGTFFIITAAVFGLLATYTHTDRDYLYLTPFLDDARGWDIYTIENGIHRQLTMDEISKLNLGNAYYLSRVLSQDMEDGGYTFLRLTSYLPFAVFLDDKLFYTTCPDSVFSMEQITFPEDYSGLSKRGEVVRCTLPNHFAGKKLTIATTTVNQEYFSTPGIILSSEEIESEITIADVGSEMIPAAGLAAAALLLMAVWLFAFMQGVYSYLLLLPITAALLQSFSHLRQLSFFSASHTALDHPLTQFIPALSLLLPLVYFLFQIKEKKNRILFGCILGVSSVVAFISPCVNLFAGLSINNMFLTENIIFYFPLAALLVIAVLEVRHKNTEFRLFLFGLGAIISSIGILYIGSRFSEGYYADYIHLILKSIYNSTSYFTPSAFLNWWSVILFLLSALIGLHKIIWHTIQMHTRLALQTERSKQLDHQLSVQKDFYDARLSHEKEIRSLRHDMNGHLNTLSMLLDDGKVTEAKNYLDGITEYHKGQTSKLFCSNPYINAVLQNYSAKCDEQHIELICNIGIGEDELPATELCLILNNAFENALDASMTVPETERQIKVQAAVRQNLFLLRVSNPFNGSIKTDNGLPVTSKFGKQHGYGLSNIRQAAERRGGRMEYHVQNGFFVLDVEFPVL